MASKRSLINDVSLKIIPQFYCNKFFHRALNHLSFPPATIHQKSSPPFMNLIFKRGKNQQRSIGVVVVDDHNLLSSRSSGRNNPTPLFHCLWRAAYVSPAAGVSSKSVKGADVATFRVDVGHLNGLAEPVRADTVCVMVTSADDATAIEPPAVAADELTH